jgi:hypothetical protein
MDQVKIIIHIVLGPTIKLLNFNLKYTWVSNVYGKRNILGLIEEGRARLGH